MAEHQGKVQNINEPLTTVVGNLTADPELRVSQQGRSFVTLTIASTPRTFNRQSNEWEDGEPLFLNATFGGDGAENIASSLAKGTRVVATGKLKSRTYKDKEGNDRTSINLDLDEIGPSLRYATATVERVQQGQQRQTAKTAPAAAPTQDAGYDPDIPF